MTDNRFRRQFLLTKQASFRNDWQKFVIKDFRLYYHPELEFSRSSTDEKELVMLGAMYDWETPEKTNQQLLDTLVDTCSFEKFLEKLSKYAGHFVILYCLGEDFFIINDACAQREIYYDDSFTTFGSQPKLLSNVIEPKPYSLQEAVEFYSSREFLSKRLFVGETTHIENIKHLLPNHYIDLRKKAIMRYFPSKPVDCLTIKDVAPKAAQMLKGYIKAVAMRKQIAMAVTAGYDSRTLFLASLDVDCKYFLWQHKNMNENHYDVAIPQRLAEMYGRSFELIPDTDALEDISDSVDFQRKIPKAGKYFENHIYLNGNISEIARSFYGFNKKITAEDLAFINGYKQFCFVVEQYRQWLKNETLFKANNYHVLDMYYWEQRTGIWVAKEKTMMRALGIETFSPFCSRSLLVLLLSTQKKDRDKYINKLYNSILLELSPKALKVPINPSFKLNIIRLMSRLKIYSIYQSLGLKYRFLKY